MPRLDEGHQTLIELGTSGAVKFYQKTVKPPGASGGGAVDTLTMLNTRFRTQWPKKLLTISDCDLNAAYDPAIFTDVLTMIQVNQLLTITFADLTTLEWYGWLEEFEPSEISEGEQPTASIKLMASMQNNAKVETPWVYTVPSP